MPSQDKMKEQFASARGIEPTSLPLERVGPPSFAPRTHAGSCSEARLCFNFRVSFGTLLALAHARFLHGRDLGYGHLAHARASGSVSRRVEARRRSGVVHAYLRFRFSGFPLK